MPRPRVVRASSANGVGKISTSANQSREGGFEHAALGAFLASNRPLGQDSFHLFLEVDHLEPHQLVDGHSQVEAVCGKAFSISVSFALFDFLQFSFLINFLLLLSLGFAFAFVLFALFAASPLFSSPISVLFNFITIFVPSGRGFLFPLLRSSFHCLRLSWLL